MLTMPAALRAALRNGAQPVVVADLDVTPWGYIDVEDYSAAFHAEIVVSVDLPSGTETHSWTESITDGWTRGSSNANCAETLALAITKRFARLLYLSVPIFAHWDGGSRVYLHFARDTISASVNIGTGLSWSGLRGGSLLICTGPSPVIGAYPIVSGVTGVVAEIDAVTRETSASGIDIVIHDPSIFDRLVEIVPLRNTTIDLWLGVDGLSWPSEWMQLEGASVKNYRWGVDGSLTLECVGPMAVAEETYGAEKFLWSGVRPLRRLREICATIRPGLLHEASFYDEDYDDVSHFVVSRGNIVQYQEQGADTPIVVAVPDAFPSTDTPAQTLRQTLGEMATMLRGCFRAHGDGTIEYLHYDLDAVAARTLDAKLDIADLDQEGYDENRINRVELTYAGAAGSKITFDAKDSISACGAALPLDVTLPWVAGRILWREIYGSVSVYTAITAPYSSDPAVALIPYDVQAGVCGTCYDLVSGSMTLSDGQTLNDDSSQSDAGNGRYTYLRVRDDNVGDEIIAIGRVNTLAGGGYDEWLWLRASYPEIDGYFLALNFAIGPLAVGEFTSQGRFGFADQFLSDSSNPTHLATEYDVFFYGIVEDVTIPIHVARSVIDRFKNGAPVVSFRLSLLDADLQIGDVISLANEDRIRLGSFRATEGATWELTRVEIEIGDQFSVYCEATLLKPGQIFRTFEPIDVPTYPTVDPASDGVIAEADNVLDGANEVVAVT